MFHHFLRPNYQITIALCLKLLALQTTKELEAVDQMDPHLLRLDLSNLEHCDGNPPMQHPTNPLPTLQLDTLNMALRNILLSHTHLLREDRFQVHMGYPIPRSHLLLEVFNNLTPYF